MRSRASHEPARSCSGTGVRLLSSPLASKIGFNDRTAHNSKNSSASKPRSNRSWRDWRRSWANSITASLRRRQPSTVPNRLRKACNATRKPKSTD